MVLGGTASYAGFVSRQLGLSTGIITSFGEDFIFAHRFEALGIHLWGKPSKKTTTFENIYSDQGRTQYMSQRAATLSASDLMVDIPTAKAIILCLIADEVDLSLLEALPEEVSVSVVIQGWLRKTNAVGLVQSKTPKTSYFKYVDMAFMSDDDIQDLPGLLSMLISEIPLVIVTHGKNGADIYSDGKRKFYPSYPTMEVDPTGAGDVFSTAFTIAYSQSKDLDNACSFAHSAASLSVQGKGVQSLPSMEQVLDRQKQYISKFLSDNSNSG